MHCIALHYIALHDITHLLADEPIELTAHLLRYIDIDIDIDITHLLVDEPIEPRRPHDGPLAARERGALLARPRVGEGEAGHVFGRLGRRLARCRRRLRLLRLVVVSGGAVAGRGRPLVLVLVRAPPKPRGEVAPRAAEDGRRERAEHRGGERAVAVAHVELAEGGRAPRRVVINKRRSLARQYEGCPLFRSSARRGALRDTRWCLVVVKRRLVVVKRRPTPPVGLAKAALPRVVRRSQRRVGASFANQGRFLTRPRCVAIARSRLAEGAPHMRTVK